MSKGKNRNAEYKKQPENKNKKQKCSNFAYLLNNNPGYK
jgi:hypothetical protein